MKLVRWLADLLAHHGGAEMFNRTEHRAKHDKLALSVAERYTRGNVASQHGRIYMPEQFEEDKKRLKEPLFPELEGRMLSKVAK